MIRAIHARNILTICLPPPRCWPSLLRLNKRCVVEIDMIVKAEEIETNRGQPDDLEISVRLQAALYIREIVTVRELEARSAEDLIKSSGAPGSSHYFGKKSLREVRELPPLAQQAQGRPLIHLCGAHLCVKEG